MCMWHRRWGLAATILLATVLVGRSRGHGASPRAADIRTLEARVCTFFVVKQLDLEKRQANELADLADQAHRIADRIGEEADGFVPQGTESLSRYYQEALANEWASRDAERGAGHTDVMWLAFGKKLADALAPLAMRGAEVLTEEQQEQLESLADSNVIGRSQVFRIGGEFTEADEGSDAAARLKADKANAAAHRYGAWTDIGRLLIAPGSRDAFLVVSGTDGRRSVRRNPSQDRLLQWADSSQYGEFRQLWSNISKLNLVNGLYLTDEQLDDLSKLLAKAVKKGVVGSCCCHTTFDTREGKRYERELEDVIDDLNGGRRVDRRDLDQLARLRSGALKAERPKAVARLSSRARTEDREDMMEEVLEILTPGQCEVMLTYKPCIVPPNDLKNPVRAGQVSSVNPAYRDVLIEARAVLPHEWAAKRYDIVEAAFERFFHYDGALSSERRDYYHKKLLYILIRARNLSEEEFALQDEELMQEMTFFNLKDYARLALIDMAESEKLVEQRVHQHFISPIMLTVLEAKRDATR